MKKIILLLIFIVFWGNSIFSAYKKTVCHRVVQTIGYGSVAYGGMLVSDLVHELGHAVLNTRFFPEDPIKISVFGPLKAPSLFECKGIGLKSLNPLAGSFSFTHYCHAADRDREYRKKMGIVLLSGPLAGATFSAALYKLGTRQKSLFCKLLSVCCLMGNIKSLIPLKIVASHKNNTGKPVWKSKTDGYCFAREVLNISKTKLPCFTYEEYLDMLRKFSRSRYPNSVS